MPDTLHRRTMRLVGCCRPSTTKARVTTHSYLRSSATMEAVHKAASRNRPCNEYGKPRKLAERLARRRPWQRSLHEPLCGFLGLGAQYAFQGNEKDASHLGGTRDPLDRLLAGAHQICWRSFAASSTISTMSLRRSMRRLE